MAVNKYQPHVMVLPEDDANSRLAIGFQLQLDSAQLRQLDLLPVAGGWMEVLDLFESVLNEPEDLKPALGPLESIGSAMAQDCRDGTDTTWGHELLRHNASELGRLSDCARPILFPSA
jgi:hypothetical protein